ncbi:MAG TPA: pyridoxal-dependent decarboxylase, partial [Rhizomicrobium sp.]|nr:pyridoxal-dependent decarboxylase [Rhizomicrobium sp.]
IMSKLAHFLKEDGSAHDHAPQWAKYRADMLKAFPSPFRGDGDPLARGIEKAIHHLNALRPEKGGPAYLGSNPALTIDFEGVKDAALNPGMGNVHDVINQAVELFEGLPNWGHPLAMCNVIPQGNTAALVAAMLTQVFSPNILEGEYAWNVHRTELETAAIIARLLQWDAKKAGGVYTYGGSGCWTYHLKYALSRVLPDSRNKGVRTDAKLLCSQQAHYTMMNSSDWMGLGMDNIVRIQTDVETNGMDLKHLENVLKDCRDKNIPVASVVCTMGTTDANAFDPVSGVRALLDRYPNAAPYGKALLYCDAVIGWSWLTFGQYDFAANPLGFSDAVLPHLKRNYELVEGMKHADAVGIDFHKTGWSPYSSSFFAYKNADEFEGLLRRPGSAYLQPRSPYNPLDYTLEVSRSATGAMAGWASLKFFGYEGFQSVLGGILENKAYLRHLLDADDEAVCANCDDYGLVTLMRVYAKGTNGDAQYQRELKEPAARDELVRNNHLTQAIGDKLWDWFRSGHKVDNQYTPYMSFSTGFRVADYNRDGSDPDAVVYALKMFPMNVHCTPHSMKHALTCVLAARDAVMADGFAAPTAKAHDPWSTAHSSRSAALEIK